MSDRHAPPPANPPYRTAPVASPRPRAARRLAAVLLAVVLLAAVGVVLYAMQATWGQLWWRWPRGWFNGPRLVAYGSVVLAVALYAGLGRRLARGAAYVVGLVLVATGGLALGFVWFVASLFTGLGL